MAAVKLDGYGSTVPTGQPAWARIAAIGDYGGDPKKEESLYEGTTPYSWQVYQLLQAAQGSAYSKETSGTLVHAENLATARLYGATFWRNPEKQIANATPDRADEKLPYWVSLLAVRTKDGQQDWEIRDACATRHEVTLGPTEANTDARVADLLGDIYVESIRTRGTDLDNPPDLTYWPTINPGPSVLDLGGGTWMSHRAHLGIKVTRPASGDEAAFLELMNVQLADFLDGFLPAWMTFAYGTFEDGATDVGFILDVSKLDFAGLGA